ncbi:MAG: Integrase [Frankiales bacterium]|jgi:integrase|nr:Integrase [Frankiales bacterium]
MQRGKLGRNVAVLLDAPSAKRPQTPMPLDIQECRRFLAAVKRGRDAARWTVAVALGLRQFEAVGLMFRGIDFGRGTLAARRGFTVYPAKNLRSRNRSLKAPVA